MRYDQVRFVRNMNKIKGDEYMMIKKKQRYNHFSTSIFELVRITLNLKV